VADLRKKLALAIFTWQAEQNEAGWGGKSRAAGKWKNRHSKSGAWLGRTDTLRRNRNGGIKSDFLEGGNGVALYKGRGGTGQVLASERRKAERKKPDRTTAEKNVGGGVGGGKPKQLYGLKGKRGSWRGREELINNGVRLYGVTSGKGGLLVFGGEGEGWGRGLSEG